MNLGVLLAILLKATLLSFSGFGSLPVLRDELVTNRRVLSDEDLNRAVAVARLTPGPMGSYVVAVGYAVHGWTGAAAGWVAISTPAFCVLPLLALLRGRVHSERWRNAIEAIILASAGLVLATATSLIPTALIDLPTSAAAAAALVIVCFTRISTIWLIVAGSAVTWLSAALVP